MTGIFDTPKPVELIKFLILIATDTNDYVLDFFAGSGTTAQAVYEVNKEKNRNNKYILIQKNEEVNENSSVQEACKKYNINPDVGDILIFTLNHYIKNKNIQDGYILTYQKQGQIF